MDTKTVKNISSTDLAIVDVGVCKAGETIVVPADFNNANFVEVKSATTKPEEEKEEDTETEPVQKGKTLSKK